MYIYLCVCVQQINALIETIVATHELLENCVCTET